MEDVGIFYGHFVNFTAILYFFFSNKNLATLAHIFALSV
jgi:hypothetical protein